MLAQKGSKLTLVSHAGQHQALFLGGWPGPGSLAWVSELCWLLPTPRLCLGNLLSADHNSKQPPVLVFVAGLAVS